MKILVDTDIGGDFDDANALALLLASPEVEVVGVSTVGAGGSALQRARVASTMLAAANRSEVPVYAGFDQPLIQNLVLDGLHPQHVLNGYLEHMAHAEVSHLHAVDFLIESARAHGSSLSLLTLGALTNLAVAVRRDPEPFRKLARIVVMGGAFTSQLREANVTIDPEAAAIVLAAGLPLQFVGYEAASAAQIPLSCFRHLASSGSTLGMLLSDMAARYQDAYHKDRLALCDVTAAVALTHPHLFELAERTVAIELVGRHTRGMTIVQTDHYFNRVPGGVPVQAVTHVDPARVVALHRERVLQPRLRNGASA